MSYFSSQTASQNPKKMLPVKKHTPKVLKSEKVRKSLFVRVDSNSSDSDEEDLSIIPLQISSVYDEEDELPSIDDDEEDALFKGKARSEAKAKSGSVAMVHRLSSHINARYGVDISPRNIGIIIEVIASLWGGSVMVPLHYAGADAKGFNYVFSFAIGTSIVNTLAWVLRFYHQYVRTSGDTLAAYHAMPSFHLKSMAFPGAISGILYACGNLASIVSVTILGEGIGYSMTQSSLLINGLWGIFWYQEITSPASIRGWLASASTTLAGMILICYNHVPATAPAVLEIGKRL